MSSRMYRIVQMDAFIRQQRFPSVATFVEQFEISERAVHNDIAFLRDQLGAPLVYDRLRRGYRYTETTWGLPSHVMSEGELLAFFLSVEITERYLGTTFGDAIRSAVEKFAMYVPAQVRVNLDQLAHHYSFAPGATAMTDPQLLFELGRALNNRCAVEVTYFTPSRNALTERTLHPYHLRNIRGDWQLVAFDSHRAQVRIFAVDRIRRWAVRPAEHFTWIVGFSLDDYLASQFITERVDEPITFVIWFDADQAHYIRERRWHATQPPLEEHADGSVTLRLTAGTLGEVKRWVLGFGRHARVLEPETLRLELAAELRSMLALYDDSVAD